MNKLAIPSPQLFGTARQTEQLLCRLDLKDKKPINYFMLIAVLLSVLLIINNKELQKLQTTQNKIFDKNAECIQQVNK